MGKRTGFEHLEFPITETTYEDIFKRFRHAFNEENLPIKPIKSVRWFASEVACGALVAASAKKVRIKGTLTLPEWRGMGYGEKVLIALIQEAKNSKFEVIEIFARYPAWFIDRGFKVVRVTPWETSVLQCDLYGLTVTTEEAN